MISRGELMAAKGEMKILHLLSQVPGATGSGIYLQALLRHAAGHGYRNYLLAGVPDDFDHEHESQALASHKFCAVRFGRDLPFPIVGMSDVMPYPSRRFSDLTVAELQLYEDCFENCLADAVARWQPDLIHSHHLWLLTSLARRKFPDIPMLVSCHGSDLRQFVNCQHLQSAVLDGCRKVDGVCALSRAQQQEIHRLYGIGTDKIHLVGAGYDAKVFYSAKKRTDQPTQIVYAGKLSRAKGLPWLLRALLQMEAVPFRFHLVGDGDGPEKREILALAGQLGDKVRIHGKLTQRQLAELLRQAELFVLPSFFEGVPLVLLEALACGCRLVATALPGVQELFSGVPTDGWVELVKLPEMLSLDVPNPGGEESFVEALQVAVEAQLKAVAVDCSADCPPALQGLLETLTWGATFRKVEDLYQRLSVE